MASLSKSFLIEFLPNFIYRLIPSNPGSSLNMSFVRQTITKMADKMAATYQFASLRCCGYSNLVIFLGIYSNIQIWIASIILWFKIKYEFCLTNDSLDGFRLPVRTREHPTLVIYSLIASKFYLSNSQFEYVLRQLTKMASKLVATYRFALVDTNEPSHLSPCFLKFQISYFSFIIH